MTKLQKIIIKGNLVEYFKDLVRSALRNQNVDTDEMAEFYLVNLLSQFHQIEKLRCRCPRTGQEEPWAITYLRALNSRTPEKVRLMRNIGDRSLYFAGVFSEYLEATSVGLNYYKSMGGSAYNRVADIMQSTHSDLRDLFSELAEKFESFVDILTEVSTSAGIPKDTDLLKMYDRWLRTRDRKAAKLLSEAGIPLGLELPEVLQ